MNILLLLRLNCNLQKVRYEKYNLFHGRLKIQKIFVTNLCGFGHNRIEGTVKGGGMQKTYAIQSSFNIFTRQRCSNFI